MRLNSVDTKLFAYGMNFLQILQTLLSQNMLNISRQF